MAKTNNLSDFLNDLADGIRTVTGGTADIPAQDFSTEIKKLKPSSYVNPTGTKTITSSGTHDVKNYANASVAAGSYTVSENVTPSSGSVSATGTNIGLVQTSSITGTDRVYITVEGSGSVGHKGIASITTAGWIAKGTSESPVTYTSSDKATKMYYLDIESKTVTPSTSTQTIKPTANKLLSQVTVNAIQTEEKTATPTASSQSITPTSGKFLSKVTVNAVPTETKTASSSGDVTPSSGKYLTKVTIPTGAYSASATLTAGSGSVSATGSGVTITEVSSKPSSGYYITATGSGSVSGAGTATVGTAGWLTTGNKTSSSTSKSSNTATKYYTVATETKTATPTASSQSITPTSGKLLSKVTIAATPVETKAVTPTKSTQTISPTSGKFLSSVTVNPIPSNYIIPSGTRTITSNGTFDVTSYASVKVEAAASGHTVYKHTITITAPGATGSYNSTYTVNSNLTLYSTTLNSSIAGEYNSSNWSTLVSYFRNCFNTLEGRNSVYGDTAISIQGSGLDSENCIIYITEYTSRIGAYVIWTNGYTYYGDAAQSTKVLKNFNSGNVIVTDVVTELGG